MTEPTSPSASAQPHGSTVQLVQKIMDKKPTLGELLCLTAVPFWFDQDLLAALRAKHDGLDDNFWALLQEFSFVQIGHGRCWYNPELRGLLLQQWSGDPQGLVAAHQRALRYFDRRLVESPSDNSAAHEELLQARLYHLLAVDEQEGIRFLLDLFDKAQSEYRLAAAAQYVSVAEGQRPALSADGQATLDYMQGRVQQLAGHWEAGRIHLTQMLEQGGLSPAIETLASSALARSLVELEQEQEGIKLYEYALAACRQQGDRSQATRIMAGLGYAYSNIAVRVWGSGWLRSPAPRVRFQAVYNIGRVLAQLPLIIYLMSKLGFRASFTAIHRIGTGTDWMVARLLGLAAQWFRRVEAAANTEGDGEPEELIRAWEGLAQLYRLLDCPRQAEAINRKILRLEGVQSEGYRAARARLGLAHSLLLREQAVQARPILEQILPIFSGYGHRRHTAETQTLLARAEFLDGQPEAAVGHYAQALDSWRQVGDQATETDVVHELEALQGRPGIHSEAQQAIIDKAGKQVDERYYRIRYSHPVLTNFQRVSLIGLVILFFFTIRLALRTEYGTTVDSTVNLVKPIYELKASQGTFPPLDLSGGGLTIDQQLRPQPPMDLVGTVLLGGFAGYLALYTALGLFFIMRAPVQIQPGQVQGVVTNQKGIKAITPTGDGKLLGWDQITLFLRSDRIVVRRPLALLSFFALLHGTNVLEINAFTQHYEALQQRVRKRLDSVPVRDLGFSLLHSKSGWLFLVSLAYLILFFILASLAPDLVLKTLGPIPYNLADLFGLAYLGLALPLAWWFAVQPLRARWVMLPRTDVVWLVGGMGLVLATLSVSQIRWWHLSLGRPDIAIGVLAILLLGLVSLYALGVYRRDPGQPEKRTWPTWLRVVVVVVAVVAIAATLFSIGWEMVSFHHLAVGNTQLRLAEALDQQGKHQEAETGYESALRAYDQSIALRPEPYMDNSRGVIYAQLGRFSDAVVAYRQAQMGDPDEPTYVTNLALLYEDQAADPANGTKRIAYYDITIGKLGEAIALMERHPGRYASQLITAHLMRAGAYYNRGQIYHDMDNTQQALDSFRPALDDYDWLADAAPDLASVYTGRGWTVLRLREEVELTSRIPYLLAAVKDFNQAIEENPDDISALSGLGWAYRFLAAIYPLCRDHKGDPTELNANWQYLESAVDAYDQVIAREPEEPNHYRVRGQLHWLVAGCAPGSTKQPEMEKSLADYGQAIALDPGGADLYNTRGHLYYALWLIMPEAERDTDTAMGYTASTLDDLETAITLRPHNLAWRDTLDEVAEEWDDNAAAARFWQELTVLNPKDTDAFSRLGQQTYQIGEYGRSLDAFGQASKLDPTNATFIFDQGLVHLAAGDLKSAMQSYRQGVQTANVQTSYQLRESWYAEAISGLNSIQIDPTHAADMFVRYLEAGRGRLLFGQTCIVIYSGSDGVSVRGGSGAAYTPQVALMTEGAEFIALERSPDGRWLHGLVKEMGVPGWVQNLPELLNCRDGVAAVPVDKTLIPPTPTPSATP